MRKKYYSCEQCGSTVLIIRGARNAWALRCGNDHVVVPYDGLKIELKLEQPPIIVPQPRSWGGLISEAIRMDAESIRGGKR